VAEDLDRRARLVAGGEARIVSGRIAQRLFEIEAYRMLALLALPIARRQSPRINAIEKSLAVLTDSLAREAGRAGEVGFTAPHLLIEGTYLVPAGSADTRAADIDRAGMRIAVSEKSAYDHFLSRTIKHATLVRGAGNSAGLGLLQAGKADVIAGVRQLLLMDQAKLPGSRVLDDRFMVIEQAMGLPKGRDAGLAYAREFIEEMKASGFVARALETSGVRGVPVAPPEPAAP